MTRSYAWGSLGALLMAVTLSAGARNAAGADAGRAEPPKPTTRTTRQIEGWMVLVDDRLLEPANAELGSRSLQLLEAKLADIKSVVAPRPLRCLQRVTIILDLTHGKLRPMQYHPSPGWLEGNGYSKELAKCVHIPVAAGFVSPRTNNEQQWCVLHELAHAYHDQVLDFDDPKILAAYNEFKKSGHGDSALLVGGRRTRHYALTDQKEFFAEMSEAYFGVNDFFPFNRGELKTAEPEIHNLMRTIWGPLAWETSELPKDKVTIIDPPDRGFFSKRFEYDGIVILGHKDVVDEAFIEARDRLETMMQKLPMVRANLRGARAELHIIGRNQVTSDLPEWQHMKGKPFEGNLTIDQRTRGMGGRLTSCGEENLLKLENDRYRGRDICIHEFAHNIYNVGVPDAIRRKFREQRQRSLDRGLWVGSYAGSNDNEFFAELSMWYFGTHGDLRMKGTKPANGREGLRAYDPEALTLLDDFYSGRFEIPRIERRRPTSRRSVGP